MKNSKLAPEVKKALSPLESNALDSLGNKELSVREIHGRLKKKVPVTSVAVTMDRLHKAGLVSRRVEKCRGGLRYIYKQTQSKEVFERSVVETTVDKLLDKFGPTALSYFHERFGSKRVKKDGG